MSLPESESKPPSAEERPTGAELAGSSTATSSATTTSSETATSGANEWGALAVERRGFPFELLDNEERLGELMLDCLREFDDAAELSITKRFEPQGVSMVLFGHRGRMLVHTWPELGAISLDVSAELSILQRLYDKCVVQLRRLERPLRVASVGGSGMVPQDLVN